MTVLVAINAVGGQIPGFYIFKGEQKMQNWIADCEVGTAFTISKKAYMTDNLWPQWLEHFVKLVPGGCLPTNCHALIVDGHRSHITKVALDTAKMLSVNVILLLTHTSHHMQPLNIACFGPYKCYFRQCVDEHTLGHLGHKVNRRDLTQLSSRAMSMALTPANIQSGFRASGLWLLNKNAMDTHFGPSTLREVSLDSFETDFKNTLELSHLNDELELQQDLV
ncbi:uncharacterized protein LOC112344376 [Selaginella moellendorffii]|uniref:uncharacterized protein LOC112344376 n=1 Tax=Selaginella moellendorffii TaxID=88036 RepID=UPI000D1C691A|nr:uncharacterized protein LOC112344376 [Selaginella moellendorffii]|eukprot:XP_024524772.1 uncharacterized protein LOC112344376 [Selaginella moellendorffii]